MMLLVAPPANTSGVVIPRSCIPLPPTVALEMVTLAVPVFLSCIDCEFVVPRGTFPKLTLAGVAVKVEAVGAVTPFPVTAIAIGVVELLAILTLPITLPAVFGANETLTVAVWPGAIVDPLAPAPLVVIPAPVIETPESVTTEFPVFFRTTESTFELPTDSVPKLRVVGVAVIIRVAVSPVPLTAIVNILFAALLAMETLLATYPAIVGA